MKRIAIMAALGVLLGGSAFAQDPKVEVSALAGWTFSDGVSFDGVVTTPSGVFDRLDPKDSFSWGLTVGYHFGPQWELEFQYDQQQSKLQANGTSQIDIGDKFTIHGYHGAFVYNWGDPDSKTRPFAFIGAGATDYPGLSFTDALGNSREIAGSAKFSGTLGLGVKMYMSHNAGIKLQGRWTPTYIKSDSEGWWCDPYWGCYVVGNAQYSNQYELTGGITLRF